MTIAKEASAPAAGTVRGGRQKRKAAIATQKQDVADMRAGIELRGDQDVEQEGDMGTDKRAPSRREKAKVRSSLFVISRAD